MTRRTRVVWTKEERDLVCDKTVQLMRQYHKMPMFQAVGHAQEALPPNRQRKILSTAYLGELRKEINLRLNQTVPERVHPVVKVSTNELELAVNLADDVCKGIGHYHEECILWRGLVTGFLAGRGK